MSEKKNSKVSSNRKKLWIIISAVSAFILIAAAAAVYFYYVYYLKTNFENNTFNKIISDQQDPIKPGDDVQYSIEFKNTGNTDVTGLIIETKIPENTEFQSASSDSEYDSETSMIKFNIPELAADSGSEVSFTVKVLNPLDSGTVIKAEKAIIEYTSRGEAEVFEIIEVPQNVVESNPVFDALKASFTDINSGTINMGDDISFKITLENDGDMNAKNVKISDFLPDKFELYEESVDPEACHR